MKIWAKTCTPLCTALAALAVTAGCGADAVSAETSTVAAEPASGVVADGSSKARIVVTLRGYAGQPVPRRWVTLEAPDAWARIDQPRGPTDAEGRAVGSVAATKPGPCEVTARVESGRQWPTVGWTTVTFVAR